MNILLLIDNFFDSAEPLFLGFFGDFGIYCVRGLKGGYINKLIVVSNRPTLDIHYMTIIVYEVDEFGGFHMTITPIIV